MLPQTTSVLVLAFYCVSFMRYSSSPVPSASSCVGRAVALRMDCSVRTTFGH